MLDFGKFVFAFDDLLLGCSSIAEVEVYGMEILHNERTIKPLWLACSTIQCYTTIVGLKWCDRNAQRIKYAIVRDRKID